VAAVRRIPQPPAALHQLLSPQFLDRASSNELPELITGEAQIAAKVLATVNAPYDGLKRPVAGIGQAVTFLGLNTVRSICLQNLLDDSFKPTDARLKRAYGEIWNASALCTRLAGKLGLPDAGTLAAQVLLSFLGHLATATLLAAHDADAAPVGGSLLDRTRDAQDRLGLSPSEIGALLLQEWGLPATIVDEVRAIDRLLSRLRPRQAGRLQLQAARVLPLMRRPAHGTDGGAPGGPRHPSCAGAPMGPLSAHPAAPAAGSTAQAGYTRAAGRAPRDHPIPAQAGGREGRRG
jgi:HD-like signal output (HDOD) protein